MPVDQQAVIIEKIRQEGILSYFWATTTRKRAAAMDALIKSGRIIRRDDDPRDCFPWMVYSVANPPCAEAVEAAQETAPLGVG